MPERACAAAAARGRRAAASGEESSSGQGGYGGRCPGTGPTGPRVHGLVQNHQIGMHLLFGLNPPGADRSLLPWPGPVPGRRRAGAANGSGALGERVFARCGGGAQEREVRGSGVEMGGAELQECSLWRSESPEETWRLARKDGCRSSALGKRGPKAAWEYLRGAAPRAAGGVK